MKHSEETSGVLVSIDAERNSAGGDRSVDSLTLEDTSLVVACQHLIDRFPSLQFLELRSEDLVEALQPLVRDATNHQHCFRGLYITGGGEALTHKLVKQLLSITRRLNLSNVVIYYEQGDSSRLRDIDYRLGVATVDAHLGRVGSEGQTENEKQTRQTTFSLENVRMSAVACEYKPWRSADPNRGLYCRGSGKSVAAREILLSYMRKTQSK